jgi:Tfp pilus assembly protein PilX
MPWLSASRRRTGDEAGIALVVAIGVLLVMGGIVAGVTALAVTANSQTRADRSSVRALAAAESGLRVGTLYLNEATPITDGQCPGVAANGVSTKTTAVAGRCGPYTVTLPTGGTTTFTITGGATTAIACSGSQVNAPTRPGLTIHQRCITATGLVNGATRRAQARVASVPFIFPVPGIFGQHNVKLGQGSGTTLSLAQCSVPSSLPNGTSVIMASVGTNGTLTTSLACWLGAATDVINGNTSRLYLGSSAPATNNGVANPSITGAQPGGIVRVNDIQMPSLDPLFQTGMDGASDASLPAGNNNATGIHAVPLTCTSAPYDAATRVLNLPNNSCAVLLDGSNDLNHPKIYDFCGLNLPNGGVLSVTDPLLAPYVQIYVDSSARKRADGTAACTSGSGTVAMGNNSTILSNASISLGAQIFIYGAPSASNPGTLEADGVNGNSIAWRNGANVKMLLVAPHSQILFQNGGTITGGISAYDVVANNNLIFLWDQTADDPPLRALYYRSSYAECAKAPTIAGNPDSGC